jgi:hypothetical protein
MLRIAIATTALILLALSYLAIFPAPGPRSGTADSARAGLSAVLAGVWRLLAC